MDQEQIKAVIEELNELLQKEQDNIDAKISEAGYRASQSFLDDMNGCSRGMSIIRNKAIIFLKEKLIDK